MLCGLRFSAFVLSVNVFLIFLFDEFCLDRRTTVFPPIRGRLHLHPFLAVSTSIRPLPSSFLGMYSLSISSFGCNILCMFNSSRVFVSIFLSYEIFQSMISKLCCTTRTARLLTASILFLPMSSVLRINLTLPRYSFLFFSFILLCWIPSLSSTPRYLYHDSFLVQLFYGCEFIYYYVSS